MDPPTQENSDNSVKDESKQPEPSVPETNIESEPAPSDPETAENDDDESKEVERGIPEATEKHTALQDKQPENSEGESQDLPKSDSESSSDVVDKNQMVEMFDKMAKESIQKITQADNSDSSETEISNSETQKLDEMVNSDPKDLILANGNVGDKPEQDSTTKDDKVGDNIENSEDDAQKSEHEREIEPEKSNEESHEQPSDSANSQNEQSDEPNNTQDELVEPQVDPQPESEPNDGVQAEPDKPRAMEPLEVEPEKPEKAIEKSKSSNNDIIQQLMNKINSSQNSSALEDDLLEPNKKECNYSPPK